MSCKPLHPLTQPLTRTLITALLILFNLVHADLDNRFRSERYAHGRDGGYPLQHYLSVDLSGPILNYWHQSSACEDGLYTVIAPRGESVHRFGPMLLDQSGHMVYFKDYLPTYNANIYAFKGEQYITFWSGNDSVGGHGEGVYYMVSGFVNQLDLAVVLTFT